MTLARPLHLVQRQTRGRVFGEPLTLISTSTTFNQFGEAETTEASTDTTCATAPADSDDARLRDLQAGGVRVVAARLFWTNEDVEAAAEPGTDAAGGSPGAILVYRGERWRAVSTQRWGGFSETLAIRIEGQG